MEEWKLRPRVSFKEIPKLEESDGKYKDLILTLPADHRWLSSAIRQYGGFWEWENVLPGILTIQEKFKTQPNDIIVSSFPKAGTTWLKALTFAIVHRSKFSFSDNHPLLKLSPHDCVPLLEHTYAGLDEQHLETIPSPRVLGTHMPYSLLPESMKTSDCRIVYIYRDPKDVLVSLWHMVSGWSPVSFNQAFELFAEDRVPYGPFWDHVLEYYKISLQNSHKVLFITYEKLKSDSIEAVTSLANFLGFPFSPEELEANVVEKVVEICSFSKLKNLAVNESNQINNKTNNTIFFRKGVVGDWKNYMTAEMASKLDKITKEKLHDSGFTY